ncbi:hypothetical protein [Vreelandella titanicae]|uniref:hypothetical protein n=1 Tax=Vreelandella titanicae TaxID=664683 RepID=UPI00241F2188|nr:hypothetical protein [Halomonas titanicae]
MNTNAKKATAPDPHGTACTITIEPTEHGVMVKTSIDRQQIAENGMTTCQALAQIGMRAIQRVLYEYEKEKQKQKRRTLH